MTKEANEVNDLLGALRDGSISLAEVARRFRARPWPVTSLPPPGNYVEMSARALADPRPDVPNSYDDVVAAYYRGDLTKEQFRTLSEAVSDANNVDNE